MIIGFGNNVVSSLAADITATQTTIQVMPGAGALFAGLLTYDYANDSNSLKVYAKITLTDAKETVFEVCHLTAVNSDMLTVVRGQEGTAAKGWSLNDVIANFATRGSENQFVQIEQLQSGHYTSAVAGGTANGLTLALPATFFLNGSTEWALKTPILIYPTLNNTGASTLQLTMGGRVMGTYPLVKGSNTALRTGDIVAKNPFLAVFNADQGRFIVLNPTTNVGAVMTVNSHAPDAAGNVKLGTAADADVGTNDGDVMSVGAFGLGAGAQHKSDAYGTIAEFFRVNISSANRPGNNAYGGVRLPIDGAPTSGYVMVGGDLSAWVGLSTTQANGVTWARVYTTLFKPKPADINAVDKGGDTMTGQLITPSVATTPDAVPWGAGAYGDQLNTQASFFQPNWQWPVNSGGIFVPLTKGTSTRKDKGYPTAVSFGYLMPANNEHAHPTIHALGDSNVDCAWNFNPYNGGISSKAGTFATQEWVNNAVWTNELHVGDAHMSADGNIWGTRWNPNGGWLWDAIIAQVQSIGQMSVNGTQWWASLYLSGMTLIVQGGYAEVRDSEDAQDRINLNISVPNRLLGVFITNKNFAQGYATYNPQVTDLTNERDGFNFVHGSKERMLYWIAVGH
jgi:hypothetical protein